MNRTQFGTEVNMTFLTFDLAHAITCQRMTVRPVFTSVHRQLQLLLTQRFLDMQKLNVYIRNLEKLREQPKLKRVTDNLENRQPQHTFGLSMIHHTG